MDKKRTKIACILNSANGDTLGRNVDRLWKEADTEILIMDNNSKDSTKKVLDKWCLPENFPRLRAWRWKKIKGSSENRNFMLKQSAARYILFLDSDILYVPGSFDYLMKRLDNSPKEMKCIGFTPSNYTDREEDSATELPKIDEPLIIKGQPLALTQYGVFKREIFTTYHFKFDEKFETGYGYEDNDLALQMLGRGLKCASVPLKYFHNKNNKFWWALHTPEFMRIDERQKYFIKKWGVATYKKYYDMKPRVSYDKTVTTKLLEGGSQEDLSHLPEEKREEIENFLKVLEVYREKNPSKYEEKKKEAVIKLNKIIYGL